MQEPCGPQVYPVARLYQSFRADKTCFQIAVLTTGLHAKRAASMLRRPFLLVSHGGSRDDQLTGV